MLSDLRYALRTLRRSPGFSAVAVAALALGIGATTAIFSLMNVVLLRPPAGIGAPGGLASFELWQGSRHQGNMGYPDFLDYRAALTSFSGLAAEARTRVVYSAGAAVQTVAAGLVSDDYFPVLGVKAGSGRLISAADAREPVAVVSPRLCATTCPSSILVNGHSIAVIGVAPADFRGTSPQSPLDLWLPIALQPMAMPRMSPDTLESRASGWLRIFGRLRPGVSLAAAQAEVRTVAARLAREYPMTNQSRTVSLVPGVGLWSEDRAELRRFLLLLLLAVALLQSIACANVAGLLLARAASRQREIAVRLALGAGTARLWRSVLSEGLLLWLVGGALGFWLAPAIAHAAASVRQPLYALRGLDLSPDLRVLAFALLITLISGLLFSSFPAWQVARLDLVSGLKDGSPGSGRTKSRLRGTLVAAQVALSLVLLATAGTVLGTIHRALAANPVSRPDEILLCSFDLSVQGYTIPQGVSFYETLLDRVRGLQGVTAASLGFTVPPDSTPARRAIFEPGREPSQEVLQGRGFEIGTWVEYDVVGPGFFHTLGIPLVQGRDFSRQDRTGSTPVAIVNLSLAARLWPGANPIGRRIAAPEWSGPPCPPVEVVGVIRDVPSRSLLGQPSLALFVPTSQSLDLRSTLIVRSQLDPGVLLPAVRQVAHDLDAHVPLRFPQTMMEHIASTLWQQRMASGLLAAFGLLGVALAAIGLYGIVARSVVQRTREIGIRLAIGARPAQIRTLAMRGAFTWVGAGFAAGIPAALAAAALLRQGIPGVRGFEPTAVAVTLVLLLAVALAAAYFPARRASRIDPLPALRCE